MRYNKKYVLVLREIYKHPYIKYSDFRTNYFSYMTEIDMDNILFALERDDMISFRISSNYFDDAGYECDQYDEQCHIVSLPLSDVVIEEKHERFLFFIIPYSITTLIALLSLLLTLLK